VDPEPKAASVEKSFFVGMTADLAEFLVPAGTYLAVKVLHFK
jgi:hypothetical protein